MLCIMVSIQALVFCKMYRINNDQIEQLQSNLLKSHACGMGDEVPSRYCEADADAENKITKLWLQRCAD